MSSLAKRCRAAKWQRPSTGISHTVAPKFAFLGVHVRAMLLERLGTLHEGDSPLRLAEVPDPTPADDGLLLQVMACGVCHTELDEIEGRTPPVLPAILGHQVVGRVIGMGKGVRAHYLGERVGVGWIHSACGICDFCRSGCENLCPRFQGTGRDAPGGYAELMTVKVDFAVKIPVYLSDTQAAPLLCAGAIGYRSLRLSGIADGQNLGLSGFGASAHLVLKMVKHRFPRVNVYVFARSQADRQFAKELGATWAGDTREPSPQKLHAIIDTTPAWTPVVAALFNLAPGGRLVVNAIRKEDADKASLLHLDYPHDLWLEKEIKSVANVTRQDIQNFLELTAQMQLQPRVLEYPLAAANQALADLKFRQLPGAKVLVVAA
jgi:alcohol dehydrogenase, propanol-preferring